MNTAVNYIYTLCVRVFMRVTQVVELRNAVMRLHKADTTNMQAVREQLRTLKNTAASCKSIPKDFKGNVVCVCVHACASY